ncbi:putative Ig domain-containing protein [Stieleria maiorica]|uniref:putative Ig domain-containing protein n=1 Tax=Stieleria maiorica TaxID=2795974 RepID=UPI0011C8DD0B|nr:putative Ig domain-containing protein [Stieleria maiorica]
MQLSSDGGGMIAHRFDIDAELRRSDVNYLLVDSRPPDFVRVGEAVDYQITAKSKSGGIDFSLEDAPDGMELSEQGRLTWTPGVDSPSPATVITSVSDGSGQQVFHMFEIAVAGVNNDRAKHLKLPKPSNALPVLPSVRMADGRGADHVAFPGPIGRIVAGGSGRFLFCHLESVGRVAVVDLFQRKIVHYLPAPGNARVVAGATRALVFDSAVGVVMRYRLDTFECDAVGELPYEGNLDYAAMGAGSEGPVMLRTSKESSFSFHLMDIDSLKLISNVWPSLSHPRGILSAKHVIRASTVGNVFSINEGATFVLRGSMMNKLGGIHGSYVGGGLLSSDGSYSVVGDKLYDARLSLVGEPSKYYINAVPSITGPYFLAFMPEQKEAGSEKLSATVRLFGEEKPVAKIADFAEQSNVFYKRFEERMPMFFAPEANVIAIRSSKEDRIDLRSFDVENALASSDVDYFFVDSLAVTVAQCGEQYRYQLSVKSRQKGFRFRLERGPRGMQITEDGTLTWNVPGIPGEHHLVVVAVVRGDSREAHHTFRITTHR